MRPTDSPEQVADHLEWLKEQLDALQTQLETAEARCAQLKPIVSYLQGTIKQLEG